MMRFTMSLKNRTHDNEEESSLDELDEEDISLPGDESDEEGAESAESDEMTDSDLEM